MDFAVSAGRLSLPLGPDPTQLTPPQLNDERSVAKAAADFESMLLSQLLKEMRQTLEPDGLFGSDGADVHGGLFDLYLSQHLASSGGFGLAHMIKQQLLRNASHEPEQPPAKPAPL